jgi:hypothetical protein
MPLGLARHNTLLLITSSSLQGVPQVRLPPPCCVQLTVSFCLNRCSLPNSCRWLQLHFSKCWTVVRSVFSWRRTNMLHKYPMSEIELSELICSEFYDVVTRRKLSFLSLSGYYSASLRVGMTTAGVIYPSAAMLRCLAQSARDVASPSTGVTT